MWLRVRVQSLGRMQETLQRFVYVEVPRFKETTVTIFLGCRVY